MRARQIGHLLSSTALAALLATTSSCGSETPHDANNREIPWKYGPTHGTARTEHLAGTGTKGKGAIAEGWKCRLSDGKVLTVTPYKLAQSHKLFGKAGMRIALFDEHGKKLETVRSDAITAENATFSFEIAEAVTKELFDVVIWIQNV